MKIWSWGANKSGQLGHGYSSEVVSTPTEVTTLQNRLVLDAEAAPLPLLISGGGNHTMICDMRGGSYSFHHLGLVNKLECQKHQILPKPPPEEWKFAEVLTSGWDFTLFLNSAGELYSVGDNSYLQLGRWLNPASESSKCSPYWEKVPISTKVRDVSAGMRHAMALGEDSTLISWGDNSQGQTTEALDREAVPFPMVVPELDFVPVAVKCSKRATIALGSDGYFYGIGLKKFGIFGDQTGPATLAQDFLKLFRIEEFSEGVPVKSFACGWNHVLVLLQNGKLMSWGRNNFGQLGRECRTRSAQFDGVPGYVKGIEEPIASISCGSEHNLALGVSGRVYAWGWNEHDNCGIQGSDGEPLHVIPNPTQVPLPEAESAELISCGGGNSFVVTKPSHQVTKTTSAEPGTCDQ